VGALFRSVCRFWLAVNRPRLGLLLPPTGLSGPPLVFFVLPPPFRHRVPLGAPDISADQSRPVGATCLSGHGRLSFLVGPVHIWPKCFIPDAAVNHEAPSKAHSPSPEFLLSALIWLGPGFPVSQQACWQSNRGPMICLDALFSNLWLLPQFCLRCSPGGKMKKSGSISPGIWFHASGGRFSLSTLPKSYYPVFFLQPALRGFCLSRANYMEHPFLLMAWPRPAFAAANHFLGVAQTGPRLSPSGMGWFLAPVPPSLVFNFRP